MSCTITIRSVSTQDVKIAQRALETVGFETMREGDAVDAYWVELSVPKKFSHGECVVSLGIDEQKRDVTIIW